MANLIKVMLWGEEIGRLAWHYTRRISYFTFNPDFLKKGLDIAPLTNSVKKANVHHLPVWGEDERIYQKLPSFLADSLPDSWGNQLFDLWRQQQHLSIAEITPLEKLSFIGQRGMGALEFIPEIPIGRQNEKVDVRSLVDLAERIFEEREQAHILPEESLTLQALYQVGTSAGGRLPKAIVAINRETGEIRSGQIAGLEGFDYCILKFGDSNYCSAELEMTYYEMATNCGIPMMTSELMDVEGKRHFMTRRFDRNQGQKLHTQTLAAISPEANSYESLMGVCRRLGLPETDCEDVFRRMVFNHLANNTDDHNKNFSFIMNQKGEWRLSPAYDMTYIIDVNGFRPNLDHCLPARGKMYGLTYGDAIAFAKDNGIRRPESIIRSVADSLCKFRTLATKNHVREEWIGRVEATLYDHLLQWGLIEDIRIREIKNLEGHCISNIRLEQACKGNIHISAAIDGIERRYILRFGTEQYKELTHKGLVNLKADDVVSIVKEFLLCKQ